MQNTIKSNDCVRRVLGIPYVIEVLFYFGLGKVLFLEIIVEENATDVGIRII